MVKTTGSFTVATGDIVALRFANGHYLTVGAANKLYSTATTIGAAQTITITLDNQ